MLLKSTSARRYTEPVHRDRWMTPFRASLQTLTPELAQIANFQCGWTDAQGRVTGEYLGKALRPRLCLAIADSTGDVDASAAVSCAASAELIHTFSLIHDDIMDGDVVRRHRPTTWAQYGIGPAILVGDALLVLATDQLRALDPKVRSEMQIDQTRAVQTMIRGQMSDLAMERCAVPEAAAYERMILDKTGGLFGYAARGGALAAGLSECAVRQAGRYGEQLGLVFQLADDLLGFAGSTNETGKSATGDLERRKTTALIVGAAQANGPAADRLRSVLAGAAVEVDELRQLILDSGGLLWARQRMAAAASRALDAAEQASCTGDLSRYLKDIVHAVVDQCNHMVN